MNTDARPGVSPGLKRGLLYALPRAAIAWLIIAAAIYALIQIL